MSAVETVDAGTLQGELADTTANPQAGGTDVADGQPQGTEAGQDQSKAATLLTEPPKADAEPEQAAPKVPEAYEIALPKESPVAPDLLAKVSELAKSLSVTDSAKVQAIVDLIHGEAVAVIDATKQAAQKGGTLWQQTVQRLEAEALADAEIGGTPERLQATVQKAQATLKAFPVDGFADYLEASALGSDVRMLKFLAKVRDGMGEDRLISGEAPKPKPKTAAQAIYPNLPSKDG